MTSPTVALDARLVGGTSTGDSTYWTGLLHGIASLGPRMRFLLFSNAERPPGIPWCDAFEWITVPARSGRWWSLATFPRAARKAGADLVHTQYTLSPLAGAGITTIHDVSFFIGPEWFKRRDLAILRRTVPASAKRARAVLTVSETSKGEIEKFIPAAKGKVTATPLACPPWIVPVARAEAQAKVQAAFGLDGPYMLSVGTRWPRKNMKLAVQAGQLLSSRFPHRLVLTGKPGWGEERSGERVLATGYVDAPLLSALYSAADLYLAPSFHEGFGLPILEAFACGCPVLCSEGGALPETVGDAAQIQAGWDMREWTQAIEALLGDSSKLDALRKRGLARVAEFSWETTARKTLEIYERAMG
ncbi:MAG: glycosyltransferase family 4 protein [Fimbriimonas ginsengisoli]|uniref:Glycosyltransferase family 4 protein n=1 Tax=Fimbriimonas ginsengisoli TaxID=1005039 RepID=A0A931PVM5_FIMGI|nr:glycosyltransferase family 4 protein [Fimbriimonas ginsengisoli]